MIQVNTQVLPHWDMSTLYSNIESTEFASELQTTVDTIDEFEALCDKYHVSHQFSATRQSAETSSRLVNYQRTVLNVKSVCKSNNRADAGVPAPFDESFGGYEKVIKICLLQILSPRFQPCCII